jgi:hypothetical protein
MPTRFRAFALLAGWALSAAVLPGAQQAGEVRRTIFITATNSAGAYVGDLRASDVAVIEGGAGRQVVVVEPSTLRLKVCLGIDEGLPPDPTFRRAVVRFVEQLQGSADVALYLLGHGNAKLLDYTHDPARFTAALTGLPLRGQGDGNLVESLFELARSQRTIEGRRTLVVLATETQQRSTVTAGGVLDELRDSGSAFYALTVAGPAGPTEIPTPDMSHLINPEEIERDRALNEGTRLSGGLRLTVLSLEGFPAALDRVRNELLNQYSVTYILPPGARSDGRLRVTTARRGIVLRAPTQVAPLR